MQENEAKQKQFWQLMQLHLYQHEIYVPIEMLRAGAGKSPRDWTHRGYIRATEVKDVDIWMLTLCLTYEVKLYDLLGSV